MEQLLSNVACCDILLYKTRAGYDTVRLRGADGEIAWDSKIEKFYSVSSLVCTPFFQILVPVACMLLRLGTTNPCQIFALVPFWSISTYSLMLCVELQGI